MATRVKLAEEALSKFESRYLICSVVAKRAKQLVKHPESQGLAWAITQALKELDEGKIPFEQPELEGPQARRGRRGRASR
ncbi:MAG: DNA-directed RNA polymerase subunit omega [Blastocatellia bacterium]|nr:DNA-directed RNA polymerase subunit omega [Blastocatellia bacterium]MCS7156462.1 DNA-directed RNA polymerase subunit omega [Blastocatellia bacterium]MCX7751797.1 DNA-directed RNA polymerase subunit omega [Blastocatellia bacterium]MDW8168899.1 DNA-directed RNA polymerase subunit omega [Acidobacteriota bacterium]MDW8256659.1 DNA-directed RNA polymerase subunit omega [Acidobacteriota bacterium]